MANRSTLKKRRGWLISHGDLDGDSLRMRAAYRPEDEPYKGEVTLTTSVSTDGKKRTVEITVTAGDMLRFCTDFLATIQGQQHGYLLLHRPGDLPAVPDVPQKADR